MQQFIKMKKQVSMTESTRLVLNKSIDLLHKLSNGKWGKDEVKREMSSLLSTYFAAVYPQGSLDKREHFIDQAYEIIDQVELGKVPLYEAIMLMNKVVVSLKPAEKAVPYSEREVIRFRPAPKEEEEVIFEEGIIEENREQDRFEVKQLEKQKELADPEIAELMGEVVKQKKALENSVTHLNLALSKVGFELRPL